MMGSTASFAHKDFPVHEQNCLPLSEIMVSGTPNLKIYAATNASAQVEILDS
jgi:hypothetical protein